MAVTSTIDTIEGKIGSDFDFHYDVGNDVLYVHRSADRETDAYGDEDDTGIIVRHRTSDDAIIGFTVINWWKRFGSGELSDSFQAISKQIEPLTTRLTA